MEIKPRSCESLSQHEGPWWRHLTFGSVRSINHSRPVASTGSLFTKGYEFFAARSWWFNHVCRFRIRSWIRGVSLCAANFQPDLCNLRKNTTLGCIKKITSVGLFKFRKIQFGLGCPLHCLRQIPSSEAGLKKIKASFDRFYRIFFFKMAILDIFILIPFEGFSGVRSSSSCNRELIFRDFGTQSPTIKYNHK